MSYKFLSRFPLRRGFIATLVISLAISALIAIYFFIFGDFGETEGKILLTTLSISFYSLTGIGSAAPLERGGRWPAFSFFGLAVAVVGFSLFLPGIWAEWFEKEAYGKSMALVALFSTSFTQAGLLSLVRLTGRVSLLLPATVTVIFALASLASAMIIAEEGGEGYVRALAVLAVLDGFGTVTIPILGKLVPAREDAGALRRHQVEIRCPRCNTLQWLDEGGANCSNCSLHITVRTGR